jgi:hypothetical protein
MAYYAVFIVLTIYLTNILNHLKNIHLNIL